MALLKTDLRNTRESAREIRFEPTGVITQTNVQKAIEQATTTPQGISGTDVNFAASPYIVLTSDTVLYVDSTGGAVAIVLPTPASRGGKPLTIKDVGGAADTNNISLTGQAIDGLTPYPIASPYGGVRLYPRTVGYTVAP